MVQSNNMIVSLTSFRGSTIIVINKAHNIQGDSLKALIIILLLQEDNIIFLC
jgi:hypothetical protein